MAVEYEIRLKPLTPITGLDGDWLHMQVAGATCEGMARHHDSDAQHPAVRVVHAHLRLRQSEFLLWARKPDSE